jgi:putative transposase
VTTTLPITRQAQLLGISRGSVYYLPRPVSEADLALMRRIDELHLEHPFMGARMLRDQLLAAKGLKVGRKHIGTLMQRMGIAALCAAAGHQQTRAGPQDLPLPAAQAGDHAPNQVWALDTTYIPMARGFVYLTAVVDVFSRKVLAHKVAITLEAWHAVEVIEQALAGTAPRDRQHRPGQPVHGVEFTDEVLARAAGCPWTGGAPGATTCSSSACGAA